MQSYTPKFKIGDTVHYTKRECQKNNIECTICDSTGIVVLQGEEFKCPKCKGEMKTSWVQAYGGEFDIVEIIITEDAYYNEPRYKYISDTYNYEDTQDESCLFETKDECMKFIEKCNQPKSTK